MDKNIQVEKSQGMVEAVKRCSNGPTVKPWADRHKSTLKVSKTPKVGK